MAGRPKNRQDTQNPVVRKAGLYLGIGFEVPGTILAGLLIGYFLDDYFGTSPWLLIFATALAFTAAFVRLIQLRNLFAREHDAGGNEKDHSTY